MKSSSRKQLLAEISAVKRMQKLAGLLNEDTTSSTKGEDIPNPSPNFVSLLKQIAKDASDNMPYDGEENDIKGFYDSLTRKYSSKVRDMLSKLIVGRQWDGETIKSVDDVYLQERNTDSIGQSWLLESVDISVIFTLDNGRKIEEPIDAILKLPSNR